MRFWMQIRLFFASFECIFEVHFLRSLIFQLADFKCIFWVQFLSSLIFKRSWVHFLSAIFKVADF